MTAEDAANIDGAKGRAIAAYDAAQTRLHRAQEKVAAARQAMERAVAVKPWTTSSGALAGLPAGLEWPSSTELAVLLEDVNQARSALDAAREDLGRLGLNPDRWRG